MVNESLKSLSSVHIRSCGRTLLPEPSRALILVLVCSAALLSAGCLLGRSAAPGDTPSTDLTATADASSENHPTEGFGSLFAEDRQLHSLEDYRASLVVDQDIAAGRCPHRLIESMGSLAYGCRVGNADFEPDREVAVAVFGWSAGSGLAHLVLVLKPGPGAADVVFEQLITRGSPDSVYRGFIKSSYQPVIAVGDLNSNGIGELVYSIGGCGMNTCYHDVRVVEGRPEGYIDVSGSGASLNAEDGRGEIFMSNSRIAAEDVDEDGLSEIVVSGGTVGSAGAGLQRERTDTFGWDGSQYALRSTVFETTEYLYHHIVDAEQLINVEDYYGALAKYLAISVNSELVAEIREDEDQELRAWVDYRIAQLMLRAGLMYEEARSYLDSAISSHGEGRHSGLARGFREALDGGSNRQEACRAVDSYVGDHLGELAGFWYYGWLNPGFAPTSVCPPWVWQDS